jgi:hypothetical protein
VVTYFKDTIHGPTVFPQWAIDRGFADVSWRQDAAARAELKLPMLPQDQRCFGLVLWVSCEDPVMREGCGDETIFPRFMLGVAEYDAVEDHTGDELFPLYTGESEDACRLMLERWFTLWQKRS